MARKTEHFNERAGEKRIRELTAQLREQEFGTEKYDELCQEIGSIVSESDGRLQWVVDILDMERDGF